MTTAKSQEAKKKKKMFQILSLCHILLTKSGRELRLESEEKPRVGHQM